MKKGIIFILKVLTLVILAIWVTIVFIDYFRTRNDQKLKFCISERTYEYDDGTTYECVGLGYKMYRYNRESINAKEFGPIFITQRMNSDGIKK